MKHLAPALLAAAWLGAGLVTGCGSEPEQAPRSAAPGRSVDAKALIQSATDAVEKAAAEEAARCLALVAEGRFPEAVSVCTRAQGMDPYNEEVRLAQEQATTEAREGAIRDCLAQVKAREFARAIEACSGARSMAPDDEKVREALEQAELEVAALAAEAEASEAADEATAAEAKKAETP